MENKLSWIIFFYLQYWKPSWKAKENPVFQNVFVTYGSKQGAVEHKQTDNLLSWIIFLFFYLQNWKPCWNPIENPVFQNVFVTYGSKQGAVEHKQTDNLLSWIILFYLQDWKPCWNPIENPVFQKFSSPMGRSKAPWSTNRRMIFSARGCSCRSRKALKHIKIEI